MNRFQEFHLDSLNFSESTKLFFHNTSGCPIKSSPSLHHIRFSKTLSNALWHELGKSKVLFDLVVVKYIIVFGGISRI